ncbi:MAG: signal peptidase I [Verrucomicrobiota bacterium]
MDKERLQEFFKRQWKEWRGFFFFVTFILIPLKSSLADWNWVPTGSMNPTIVEGDLVYVNKLAYDLRFPLTLHRLAEWSEPERGDVVVLFSPEKERTRLVKRVIALPGDTVEMRRNVLYLNGEPLEYTELDEDEVADLQPDLRRRSVFAEEDLAGRRHAVMSLPRMHTPLRNFPRTLVPEGSVFVMGDNRDLSKDSRSFGFADRKSIVGRASHVIVSFNKLDKYQPRFGRFFSALK